MLRILINKNMYMRSCWVIENSRDLKIIGPLWINIKNKFYIKLLTVIKKKRD